MASENKLQDIIRTSLENIRNMVDANTVIGNPIPTDSGTTIIPISKISMGFASGGLDFAGKKGENGNGKDPAHGNQNFGGGGGTGLSIVPVGFLVVDKEGHVDMINTGMADAKDPVGQIADLVERSPEIISKIKVLFKKKSPAEKAAEED